MARAVLNRWTDPACYPPKMADFCQRNRLISIKRDLAADWKKCNAAERLLAGVLIMLVGLPLWALITGAPL